jgi:hypothetical protein
VASHDLVKAVEPVLGDSCVGHWVRTRRRSAVVRPV